MATQADVRRIALSLPETVEATNDFAFSVRTKDKPKGFAWVWKERVDPKKARVPQPKVLAVRTDGLEAKEALLATGDEKFFTEPHYHGFPAVLVRLAAIGVAELEALLTDAWRCMAPKALVTAFDERSAPPAPRGSAAAPRRPRGRSAPARAGSARKRS